MRWSALVLVLVAGCAHSPDAEPRGCFEQHLVDAIELNEARRPLYAEASGGRSEGVSRRLLDAERALLPIAWALDSLEGDELCAVFEPMSRAAAYGTTTEPVDEDFVPYDPRALRSSRALLVDVEAALVELEAQPRYHCMLRHQLESLRRVLTVSSERRALINLHLAGLEGAAEMDALAAPVQAEGVGIICDDVPPIPARPR